METKDQQEKQDMMPLMPSSLSNNHLMEQQAEEQVFISTSWHEGSIWIGSTPKKVDDFTSLDSIGQKVVQYIHSEREQLKERIKSSQTYVLEQELLDHKKKKLSRMQQLNAATAANLRTKNLMNETLHAGDQLTVRQSGKRLTRIQNCITMAAYLR